MKLAAIDIGSNAARLLIVEVISNSGKEPLFTKLSLVRVPLRLGFDVFEFGEIRKEKSRLLRTTMKAFKLLMKVYEVSYYKACATSAMRDAANRKDILRKIKLECGLDIEVISGDKEASYICDNHIAEKMEKGNAYLYIDVGGGSTELTFFSDGKLQYKESFNIGTIRLLKKQVKENTWDEMKEHIQCNTKSKWPLIAIGSGGNINKIFSMSKTKENKPLSIQLVKDYYHELSRINLPDRMRLYSLKADRADVIVPALQIYSLVMTWANIEEIFVPRIGLADGMIQKLFEEIQRAEK
ncbi:MAG: exopolyphosphatase [Bacteroidetes bacterium]|nr:exopolyphosphatase [Bacteroidota bacterium]